MALIYADRVKETTTTTGTGTLTLAGAVAGYQAFSDAMSNSDTCYYCVTDGTNWEVGLGTYSTGTLARTSILSSSNADAAVNWTAGTRNVFITYPAGKISDSDHAHTGTYQPVLSEGAFVNGDKTKLDGIATSANNYTHPATHSADIITDGTTNKAYTATEQSKLAGIETGADVTDTTNVTSAGALMDSEVDADIKTLALPANTTISVFGASLVDDADAATARSTLGLGNVDNTSDATKNSATVTLTNKTIVAGSNTISGIANSHLTTTAGDLGGVWASWTPTWTGVTIGNATVTAYYTQIGKTVNFYLNMTWGSTTTMGTFPRFSLPVAKSTNYTAAATPIGRIILSDNGVFYFCIGAVLAAGNDCVFRVEGVGGTYNTWTNITSTAPFTWATGDQITANGTYEAA